MARVPRRPMLTAAAAVGTIALAVALTSTSVSAARRPSGGVAGVSSLNAISCPIATHCVAVGADVSGNGKSAVVSTSNGSAKVWAGSTRLHQWGAIACAVPERCVAVATGVTAEVTVANGATRVVSAVHVPSNQIAAMGAIACPNSTSCYAVGFEGTEASSKALVAHLSSTGALLGTTLEASSSGVGAIACPTSTRCLIAAANRAHPEKIQLLENGHLGAARAIPAKTYVQAMACHQTAACYFLGGKTTGQKTNLLYSISPTTGAVESEATIGGNLQRDRHRLPHRQPLRHHRVHSRGQACGRRRDQREAGRTQPGRGQRAHRRRVHRFGRLLRGRAIRPDWPRREGLSREVRRQEERQVHWRCRHT